MPRFDWFSVEGDGLPTKANNEFSGAGYSVPVIGMNRNTKQVFDLVLVYDFGNGGWCYNGLPDGPNGQDDEVLVITDYGYLPECDF